MAPEDSVAEPAAQPPVLVPNAELTLTDQQWEHAAQLLQAVVADGGAIGWLAPPSTEEVTRLFQSILADSRQGNAHVSAVVAGNTLIGIGYWQRYGRQTNRQNADLQKIAVAPSHRRLGAARMLCQHLVDSASDDGIEILTLDVRADNASAIHLYESLGFARYGMLPQFIAMNGRRYDKAFYYLSLQGGSR